MEIFVEFSFDSAHFLPTVPATHKCRRMHGHTYRLKVWVEGPLDETFRWVIDYAFIKSAVDRIIEQLDHRTLNEIPGLEIPTCEIIAQWIATRLGLISFGSARISAIELRETERAGVRLVLAR